MADAPRPQKAIDFLTKKVNAETENWDDLKWGEHAHALTVAHSANAGVLDEIHRLLNDAVEKGTSFQDFRNGMLDMMKKSGWYGGAGHTEKDKKYINWRIGVIYDTNMKTAYAQAEYRDQLQGAALRPIWVYQSQLSGANRRQEHIDLHGKAFRYDDPFWDTYYPPNGWGCECYVNTESEHSAEKAGIKPQDSKNITPPEIDPSWKYNVGREALAPNFSKYQNLPPDALKQAYANYRNSMNRNRMSEGEFKTLIKRTNEPDYKPLNVNYEVGNLEEQRFQAMREKGVTDSKVMATDARLRHGTSAKVEKQKIADDHFSDLYKTLGEPEEIYENMNSKHATLGREFHFVKKLSNGKIINIVLRGRDHTALQIITMGEIDDHHKDRNFKKIW